MSPLTHWQSPAQPAAGVAAITIHTQRMSGERARGLAVVALKLFTEIAALAQYQIQGFLWAQQFQFAQA